jgi:hypothetical protein
MKWQDKLNPYQQDHFYRSSKCKNTITAFKHTRDEGLIHEPIYGCCFECWIIANKLGLENTLNKANLDKWMSKPRFVELAKEYLSNAGMNIDDIK